MSTDTGKTHGPFAVGPVPASAGIGLRHPHVQHFLESAPATDWIEVHSENYLAEGGPKDEGARGDPRQLPVELPRRRPVSWLPQRARRRSPRPPEENVRPLRARPRFRACLVERGRRRLSQGSPPAPLHRRGARRSDSQRRARANRARPPDLDRESLDLCDLRRLDGTGMGIHGRDRGTHRLRLSLGREQRPCQRRQSWLRCAPLHRCRSRRRRVREIHVAGHSTRELDGDTILIDDHGAAVDDAVWRLLRRVVRRIGPRPTLVEWDSRIPLLPALLREAEKAEVILDEARAEMERHGAA